MDDDQPSPQNPKSAQDASERRRYPRKRVLWMAEVSDAAGRSAWAVVINVSSGGAKLRFDGALAAPNWPKDTELHMEIPGRASIPAAVVWRSGSELGVRFRLTPEEATRRLANVLDR